MHEECIECINSDKCPSANTDDGECHGKWIFKSSLKTEKAEVLESNSTQLLSAIGNLVKEWETQGGYLNNPHDHAEDRAGGRVYQECAKALKQIASST